MINKHLILGIIFYFFLSDYAISQSDKEESFEENIYLFADMGMGYWHPTVPDGIQPFYYDYIEGLKSGVNLTLGAKYNFNDNLALGPKYNFFSTGNSLNNIGLIDNSGEIIAVGTISDQIKQNTIGLTITGRVKAFSNIFIAFNLTPSYLFYKQESNMIINQYTYKFSTYVTDVGADMIINMGRTSLYFGFGILLGKSDQQTVNGVEESLNPPENLMREYYKLGVLVGIY